MTTVPLSFDVWARDHASATFTRVGRSADTLSSRVRNVGSSMSAVGSRLTTAVTLPLVAVGAASVKLAADFDKTMRQVAIATNGPAQALRDLALEMGQETAFSAGDASEAMLELAKGGMTAAQIQGGAMAATMKLAAAGSTNLGNAATFVSNAMHAFGLEAKDASGITTALAGAANGSSASVESLGQGLSQVSAVAKDSGLSLNETVGALAAFDNAGIKGSDAGTSLKTMLARLVPQTQAAQKGFTFLHLGFTKANGDFKSLTQIAEILQRKFGDMSQAERAVAFNTLFGSDARRAATVLMNEGSEGISKYIKATRDQVATNRLANASMQGLSGAIERAKGSLETAGITLGTALAPIVVSLAGKIEDLANWFSNLSPQGQKLALIIGGVALAAGPLLLIVGSLATAIAAVGTPVGAAVLAIAALVAAFTAAYSKSEEFRRVVDSSLKQAKQTIATFVEAAKVFWDRFGGLITNVATNAFKNTLQIIRGVLKVIQGVLDVFIGVLTGDWSRAWKGVKEILSGALDVIKGSVKQALNLLISAIQTWGGKVVGWFKSLPRKIVYALAGLAKALFIAGENAIEGLINGIKSMAGSVASTVADIAKNSVTGAFKGAMSILSPSKVMHGLGVNVMEGLIDGISSKIQSLKSAMQSVAQAVSGLFGNPLSGENVNTAVDIFREQGSQLSSATRLRNDIRKLIHKGLSRNDVQQLVESGNFAAIHSLASSNRSQVQRYERGQNRLDRVIGQSSGLLNEQRRARLERLKDDRDRDQFLLKGLRQAIHDGFDGAEIILTDRHGHGRVVLHKARNGGN